MTKKLQVRILKKLSVEVEHNSWDQKDRKNKMSLYTQLTDSKMMIRQNPGNNEAWVYSISSNRKFRLSAISTLKLGPNLVITNVSPKATPYIIFYCHYLSYNNALPQKKFWNQLL